MRSAPLDRQLSMKTSRSRQWGRRRRRNSPRIASSSAAIRWYISEDVEDGEGCAAARADKGRLPPMMGFFATTTERSFSFGGTAPVFFTGLPFSSFISVRRPRWSESDNAFDGPRCPLTTGAAVCGRCRRPCSGPGCGACGSEAGLPYNALSQKTGLRPFVSIAEPTRWTRSPRFMCVCVCVYGCVCDDEHPTPALSLGGLEKLANLLNLGFQT